MIPFGDAAAAQHLFRHFNDARSLRRNILAAPYFGQTGSPASISENIAAAKQFRRLVFAIVESLKVPQRADRDAMHALRQHAIIIHYDIGGRPLNTVAAELGIGRSKFYFERRAALARVAEALKEAAPQAAVARDPSSDGDCDSRLNYASAFRASGQFDLCVRMLRAIIASPQSRLGEIIALRRLVEALCEDGRMADADSACREMQTVINPTSLLEAERSFVRAETIYAQSIVCYYKDNLSDAFMLAKTARYKLLTGPSLTKRSRASLASILQFLGGIHAETGSLEAAAMLFNEALSLLDHSSSEALRLRIRLLTGIACALAAIPGRMRSAREASAEAMNIAGRVGLPREISGVHATEATLRFWRGDHRGALAHILLAQQIADVASDHLEAARISLAHARIDAACGDRGAALKRLQKTRRALPEGNYLWVQTHVLESEALLGAGAYQSSVGIAEFAATCAERLNNHELFGCANLMSAQGYQYLGDTKRAKATITTSVASLKHNGSAFALLRAFNCSANITGNRHHRADASDLLAAMKA